MNPLEIIRKILENINPVLARDQHKKEFPVDFTFYHVLERAKFSLESIAVLVKDGIAKHDHGIGLILRNLLTDFITTGYFIKILQSDQDVKNSLYSLYNTDLKKTDSFMKLLLKYGVINQTEMDKFMELYVDENHIYNMIRTYAEENKLKNFPPTSSIIEEFLKADSNDLWIKQVQESYDIWISLSKYEHVGWNSYHITRKTNENSAIKRLDNVLSKTLILTASCLAILKEKESEKKIHDLMEGMLENNEK